MLKITHKCDEVEEFISTYLRDDGKRLLFIGTVGFNDVGNYFPTALSACKDIDYKFFIEERTIVPQNVLDAGNRNRIYLETTLTPHSVEFVSISIIAEDAATVGGRNAVKGCAPWLLECYTDIIIDVTSMSRGVCFSVSKQVVQFAHANNIAVHLMVAERDLAGVDVTSMSSDVACYMHGYQQDMETDELSGALVLWIPQLAESASPSLDRIFSTLKPSEVCPVLPFPAASPKRADELLVKFRPSLLGSWDVNLLDLIYAHESDPLDVCETISRLHIAREKVFSCATTTPSRTVLSPSGWRVGSVGMLLAALELELPVMYVENIGYTVNGSFPPINVSKPDCRWHIWLLPE